MLQSPPTSLSEQPVAETGSFTVLKQSLFKRWGFLRNVALLTGGTAVAQVLSMLLSPVITRLYRPSNLGDFALFTSFLNLFLVASSLKYELGIVSAENEREASQLSFLSLVFCLPVSVLSGAALWMLMHYQLLGFGDLPSVTPLLMVPAICAAGAFVALRYWFIRQENFALISNNQVLQHGTRAITQSCLGLLGPNSIGLFLGEITGRFAGLGRMLRIAWPSLRSNLRDTSWSEFRSVLGKHRKLPVYSLGSSFLDTLAANLAVPLMIQCYGTDAGGHFALVQRVLTVPLALIASSVADAFHSRLALHARENAAHMLPFFHRTTLFLLASAGVPSLILLMAGPKVFALVFGSGWALSGTLAAISIPWFLAQFIVSPLSRLVFVLSGQEFKLVYDIFVVLGVIGVFGSSRYFGWSFYHAVLALSIMNAVAYTLYYFVLLSIVRKYSVAPAS